MFESVQRPHSWIQSDGILLVLFKLNKTVVKMATLAVTAAAGAVAVASTWIYLSKIIQIARFLPRIERLKRQRSIIKMTVKTRWMHSQCALFNRMRNRPRFRQIISKKKFFEN